MPIAEPVEYEVQELKVNLGDHVQAGQMLVYLADHRYLYIEARALKQEVRQLTQATKEGWPVEEQVSPRHWVFLRGGEIGLPFVGEELPHIAHHIEQSVPIRGVVADRRGCADATSQKVRSCGVNGLIAPRKERVEAAAGPMFPLRLGGQALSS